MIENHFWNQARQIPFQTSPEIVGSFDIGFDSKIPEDTRDALMKFVYWVEDHFSLPITLWVDFKYKHYLIGQNHDRVGYRFYWVDFANYPVFTDPDDIPVIELAVRTEHRTIEEILLSFIEAISRYYAWLLRLNWQPNEQDAAQLLQTYLDSCSAHN